MSFKKPFSYLIVLILAGLIIYMVSDYLHTGQKNLGSFEYVRKGEDLLDKAKYKEAVACFEKAYEQSPENEIIMQDLVYSYFKYGDTFAESKDFDKAIDILKRAREVMEGPTAAMGLAIMYSNKAMHEMGKGDMAKAMEDLDSARRSASDYDKAQSNLAISLFNDGVKEFKEGREENAIICLKESLLANEESYAFEFLGDIYYKRTQLEDADFFWKKAKESGPDNKDLDEKLSKVTKEIELSKGRVARQSPHFEIIYDKNLSLDSVFAGEVLEGAYLDIGADLDYFPSEKTRIFFYSRKEFADIFKVSAMVAAFYDGNIRMPLPETELNKQDLSRYIRHEYTHAIVSAITNNNCSPWFSEGMAMWEEHKANDRAIAEIFPKLAVDHEISISAVDIAFRDPDKVKDIRPFYLMAYTVVKFMVDDWGMGGLKSLLKRVGTGQHIANAIDDEFLLSEKEFESRWIAYLRKAYL